MKVHIHTTVGGFCPPEFQELFYNDPESENGRYNDINGPQIGRVVANLDWTMMDRPAAICLVDPIHGSVAMGFAGPIRFYSDGPIKMTGINLSYAVHSAHEGRGYGLAVSCLAMMEAERIWGHKLGRAHLNIQTRAVNARSNSLIRRLTGQLSPEAAFDVRFGPAQVLSYVGGRAPWTESLNRAEMALLTMDFLQEHSDDDNADDCDTAPSPSQ